jgi:hypothetical protein
VAEGRPAAAVVDEGVELGVRAGAEVGRIAERVAVAAVVRGDEDVELPLRAGRARRVQPAVRDRRLVQDVRRRGRPGVAVQVGDGGGVVVRDRDAGVRQLLGDPRRTLERHAHVGGERHLRLVDIRLVALGGPEGLDDRQRLGRVLALDDERPAAVVPLAERRARALVLDARDREVDVGGRGLRRADRPAHRYAVREQPVEEPVGLPHAEVLVVAPVIPGRVGVHRDDERAGAEVDRARRPALHDRGGERRDGRGDQSGACECSPKAGGTDVRHQLPQSRQTGRRLKNPGTSWIRNRRKLRQIAQNSSQAQGGYLCLRQERSLT